MADIDRTPDGKRIVVIAIALLLAVVTACALYGRYRSDDRALPGFDWHLE